MITINHKALYGSVTLLAKILYNFSFSALVLSTKILLHQHESLNTRLNRPKTLPEFGMKSSTLEKVIQKTNNKWKGVFS